MRGGRRFKRRPRPFCVRSRDLPKSGQKHYRDGRAFAALAAGASSTAVGTCPTAVTAVPPPTGSGDAYFSGALTAVEAPATGAGAHSAATAAEALKLLGAPPAAAGAPQARAPRGSSSFRAILPHRYVIPRRDFMHGSVECTAAVAPGVADGSLRYVIPKATSCMAVWSARRRNLTGCLRRTRRRELWRRQPPCSLTCGSFFFWTA